MRHGVHHGTTGLFPLVFNFDREFSLSSCSSALKDWFPDADGRRLQDVFSFKLPRAVESFDELLSYENKLVLLVSTDHTFAAKGQLIREHHVDTLTFVGVPWLSWMAVKNPGQTLDLRLFPPFDSQLEQEFLISAQSSMIGDFEALQKELEASRRLLFLRERQESQMILELIEQITTPVNEFLDTVGAVDESTRQHTASAASKVMRTAAATGRRLLNYCSSLRSHYAYSAAPAPSRPAKVSDLAAAVVSNVKAAFTADALMPINAIVDSDASDRTVSQPEVVENILTMLLQNALQRAGKAELRVSVCNLGDASLQEHIDFTINGQDTSCSHPVESSFPEISEVGSMPLPDKLTICRRLAASIHGALEITFSEKGRTEFRLRIPMNPTTSNAMNTINEQTHVSPAGHEHARHQALIVGQSMQAYFVRNYLQSEGITVAMAADSEEFAHFSMHNHFQLVLVDLSLPASQLVDLANQYRDSKDKPTLMAIGDSGTKDLADHIEGLQFASVIREPENYAALKAATQPLLQPSAVNPGEKQRAVPSVDFSRLEEISRIRGIKEFQRQRSAFLDSVHHHVRYLEVLADVEDHTLLVDEASRLGQRLEDYGAYTASEKLVRYAQVVRNHNEPSTPLFAETKQAINGAMRVIDAFNPSTAVETQL